MPPLQRRRWLRCGVSAAAAALPGLLTDLHQQQSWQTCKRRRRGRYLSRQQAHHAKHPQFHPLTAIGGPRRCVIDSCSGIQVPNATATVCRDGPWPFRVAQVAGVCNNKITRRSWKCWLQSRFVLLGRCFRLTSRRQPAFACLGQRQLLRSIP